MTHRGSGAGRVNVDGVSIEYEVTGRGRPVVLLHGFPDTGRLWRHQVPALADAGFQVIVQASRRPEAWATPPELPAVKAPTMGVWGTGETILTEAQMTDSAAHVTGPWRYERLDGAGHWLPLDAPDAVSSLLLDFLPG